MDLPLLIADASAERVGYITGVILGSCIILSIFGFAIFAVVKAITRKTTGWIVAGSLGGLLILSLGAVFTAGFVNGIQNARARRDGLPGATSQTTTTTPRTVQGRNVPYQIVLPPDWTSQRAYRDFDLFATHADVFFAVIAEEASLGTPEAILGVAQQRLRTAATELQFSDATPVKIDGRDWLQFDAKCRVEKVPFAYQFYVYAGPEGTLQMIGWTFQNLAAKRAGTIRDLAMTLRLPSATASPTPASAPSPEPTPALKKVSGAVLDYHLEVPSDWTAKNNDDAFDLLISHRSLSVGIVAEEGSVGSPEVLRQMSQRRYANISTNLDIGKTSTVKIDGRDWLQFDMKCQINKIPLAYQYYVYAGPEGSYRLVCWTMQNLYERDAYLLRDVAMTFRFPPPAPAPTPMPQPAASASPMPPNPAASPTPKPTPKRKRASDGYAT